MKKKDKKNLMIKEEVKNLMKKEDKKKVSPSMINFVLCEFIFIFICYFPIKFTYLSIDLNFVLFTSIHYVLRMLNLLLYFIYFYFFCVLLHYDILYSCSFQQHSIQNL